MSGFCVEGSEGEGEFDEQCFVCGQSLRALSAGEKQLHLNHCLNALEAAGGSEMDGDGGSGSGSGGGVASVESGGSSVGLGAGRGGKPQGQGHGQGQGEGHGQGQGQGQGEGEGEGEVDFEGALASDARANSLRAESFSCVICGVDLSRRNITARCHHLKRCSRLNGIGIRDLLQLLAPHQEHANANELETESDQGGINVGDIVDLSGCDDDDGALSTGELSTVASIGGDILGKRSNSGSANQVTSSLQPRNATDVLMAGAKRQAMLTNSTSAPVSATSVLMANAKLKWSNVGGGGVKKVSGSGNKGKRSGGAQADGGNAQKDRFCPAYKKVQQGSHMTKPIIVDGFNYSSTELSDCYFLTHFHSDHYGGLSKHFSYGNIYCSPATCSLVKLKLNVPSRYLHALSLDQKHTVMCDGVPVEVTLTDANHCPGAVLILFQFPNSGTNNGANKIVLHTGDFRFDTNMLETSRMLRQLASEPLRNSKQLVVYLDTTYCDPSHIFPPQDQTIAAVNKCVADDVATMDTRRQASSVLGTIGAASEPDTTLYVFGAYGIGKERVFMSVATMLDKKVYVEKSKWKMMLCFDWSPQELSRLTATDPNSTNIWVVPMNHINFKSLEGLKLKKRGCKRVVAFQPTGWTFTGRGGGGGGEKTTGEAPLIRSRHKDGNTIHAVAYSEHSSFNELVQFVSIFKPHLIIPTVNTYKDKVKVQLDYLRDGLKNVHQQVGSSSREVSQSATGGISAQSGGSAESGVADFTIDNEQSADMSSSFPNQKEMGSVMYNEFF